MAQLYVKLPKTRKTIFVPSVIYQLRERELELIKCNADGYCMYSALNVNEGGNSGGNAEDRARPQKIRDNLLDIIRNGNGDMKKRVMGTMESNETIEDHCQQKANDQLTDENTWGDSGMLYARLYAWCYQRKCNVRIYSVHDQTNLLQDIRFPDTYSNTFHDADKRVGFSCMEIIMMLLCQLVIKLLSIILGILWAYGRVVLKRNCRNAPFV